MLTGGAVACECAAEESTVDVEGVWLCDGGVSGLKLINCGIWPPMTLRYALSSEDKNAC